MVTRRQDDDDHRGPRGASMQEDPREKDRSESAVEASSVSRRPGLMEVRQRGHFGDRVQFARNFAAVQGMQEDRRRFVMGRQFEREDESHMRVVKRPSAMPMFFPDIFIASELVGLARSSSQHPLPG
ncbi:hypothetical protein KM043_005080 [Ampulex compressa]|nr:hypothetical protein KM043_005080 [Ampulex compressa]